MAANLVNLLQTAPDDAPAAPPGIVWLPSEAVLLLAPPLPPVPAHQRRMALTYAVEESVAAPLETVEVVAGPLLPPFGGAARRILVAVVAQDYLAERRARLRSRQGLVADVLAVPVPAAGWSVWASYQVAGDARLLVRCADGTGFACGLSEIAPLWQLAGSPELTLYGAGLPAFPDLSAAPLPPPDPAMMRFDLARPAGAALRLPRLLWASAAMVLLAAGLHLAVLTADVIALGRTADERQAALRAALVARGQPGRDPAGELTALLAASQPPQRGAFLPLLAQVSGALLEDGAAIRFSALRWNGAEGNLTITASAPDLAALQQAQSRLSAAGLAFQAGPATSGRGEAEAELVVTAVQP